MAVGKDLSLANRLISALPAPERALLLAHCELVELRHRQVLSQAGQPLDYAWFPLDSFVCVAMPSDDAPNVQVAMVGNEGMLHTSLVLRVAASAFTGAVQGAGRAFRIPRGALESRLLEDPFLRDVLSRYAAVFQTHLARQLVCVSHHTLLQRLARWLLMTRDLSHSSELFLTHQALAFMLGVRRESVSRAASAFEQRGLVSYSHGYMMLRDEAGLERISCHCYRASLLAYERILEFPAGVGSPGLWRGPIISGLPADLDA